jgi:hypothetical protein
VLRQHDEPDPCHPYRAPAERAARADDGGRAVGAALAANYASGAVCDSRERVLDQRAAPHAAFLDPACALICGNHVRRS